MSWLKFDTATPEKPEVFAITVALGWEDPDLTVGKLLKVWRWFDLHSLDGNASSVTLALLDRLIGVTGLSQAMVDVGWLDVSETGLTLPNFENHNGKTAKDRALTAKRASNYRSNDKSNARIVTNALPREEKRREEKKEVIKDKSAVAPILPNWIPLDAWSGYVEMRKRIKKPMTDRAVGLKIKDLDKFKQSGHDIAAILDKSTANNWTDLYEPKPMQQKNGHVNKQEALEASNRAVVERLLAKEAQYASQ